MLEDRIRPLNSCKSPNGAQSVLYVLSRDQRLADNHALLAAQADALNRQLPLLIVFNFTVKGYRSKEHYAFMIAGLAELEQSLKKFSIPLIYTHESTDGLIKKLTGLKPASVYFDFSPLKGPRKLHQTIASSLKTNCYEVDTHNIIPAWVASDHQEFAAHTFRHKVHRLLSTFLVEPPKLIAHPHQLANRQAPSLDDITKQVLSKVTASGITIKFESGEAAAMRHLRRFITAGLGNFALSRNDPSQEGLSDLSPYLHFGQISSLRVALESLKATDTDPLLFQQAKMASPGTAPSLQDGMNALFEEMIVRKELSDNFCLYSTSYTDFAGVPAWAHTTLREHTSDKREFKYTRTQWEVASTHDPAWNAAQNQLKATGKIHGYMRMYWAKKMLEWSASPEEALADCIYLNDKYSIDGGDPNGYVGILWSIAGLHDRPWTERPVYGKVRYMNYLGLKRKFNIESYIQKWTNQTKLI